jgi:hypothetical protein
MNKKEAAKLLTLIKLSYPASYRDQDAEWMMATINMWAVSFRDIPYSLIEQGFNHYRMTHKFPPTVAEMVEELRHIHHTAVTCALIQKDLGNAQAVEHYKAIMAITDRFKKDDVGGLDLMGLQGKLIGGGYDDAHSGASGDRTLPGDRISLPGPGR